MQNARSRSRECRNLHSRIACECGILFSNIWKNDDVPLDKSKYIEVNWQKIHRYVSEIPAYCEAAKNMCRTYVHMHVHTQRGGDLDMPPSINRISA